MTDKTTFAALLTQAQQATFATTAEAHDHHSAEALVLARDLLQRIPADILVVTVAKSALGLLAAQLRESGIDPATYSVPTETGVLRTVESGA